jgi:hypothetical protein
MSEVLTASSNKQANKIHTQRIQTHVLISTLMWGKRCAG